MLLAMAISASRGLIASFTAATLSMSFAIRIATPRRSAPFYGTSMVDARAIILYTHCRAIRTLAHPMWCFLHLLRRAVFHAVADLCPTQPAAFLLACVLQTIPETKFLLSVARRRLANFRVVINLPKLRMIWRSLMNPSLLWRRVLTFHDFLRLAFQRGASLRQRSGRQSRPRTLR